jgi:hypothetical protein
MVGMSESLDASEQLSLVRGETRFEIGLLHDRVNALLGAEAFLTIAYTGAMSNAAPWGPTFSAVVAPALAVLGLLLALLAWPGISTTVSIVLQWTAHQDELLRREPGLVATPSGLTAHGRGDLRVRRDQWRSMLFFRAVPVLFVLVWVLLAVVALVLPR